MERKPEDKIAGLSRKEFIALPMEERHKRLAEQAKEFVKEHGYLPDDPCDGHSTMIQPKPEVRCQPLTAKAESLSLPNHTVASETIGMLTDDILGLIECDVPTIPIHRRGVLAKDLVTLFNKHANAENQKEADWLEKEIIKWRADTQDELDLIRHINEHIATLRQPSEEGRRQSGQKEEKNDK